MKHPLAEILEAIARGEAVECRRSPRHIWFEPGCPFGMILQFPTPDLWRIKPRTININGHEVPEPLREAPAKCAQLWVPSLNTSCPCAVIIWTGQSMHVDLLEAGLVHLTREAAEAHARALLSFTEQPA